MKKVINFLNRTKEQIFTAYGNLKLRYKKVKFIWKLKNGLWDGFFLVEGIGKRQIKYK